MGEKSNETKSNNDRSDTINPNNPKHQTALDEHSRRTNPKDPSNSPGPTRPSNPPGKGKR
ncbi:hypothetical protein [Hyalangium rubrum]|uniref:Uncharacterized protein n=1 Tax=Hyalangium rubrum TaxID=3103134 RepID=A0ABU5H9T4_9BACT|nr:hypothetical protein [Hyalangium sp. s54d21]MDY7230253.1 hypothetical protein [Hyalangium sp. s54d21]